MPAKNAIKVYLPGGIYHAYNRGVEKRKIFLEQADYEAFEFFIHRAIAKQDGYLPGARAVSLYVMCLMPNHFHLLLRQRSERGMEALMRSAMSAYVRYFNRRYDRVGPLFQGPYKASLITSDEKMRYIRQYVIDNPVEAGLARTPEEYPFLRDYSKESPSSGLSLPRKA